MIFGFEPFRAQRNYALEQALCVSGAPTRLQEPCSFTKVPNGTCTHFSTFLRVQKEGTQMCMSECRQGLTLTKCGLRFPQYDIYYKWGYYSAPLGEEFFSGCYVQ